MIAIPFFYFLIVAVWFYRRNHKLGIDVAAASLLVMISFFAIVIDVKEIYGDFGINRVSYTLPTLILFCLQWTIMLMPLHYLSRLELKPLPGVKLPMLYILTILMSISAAVMVVASLDDIKDALIMDFADVRDQHNKNLNLGVESGSNYLLLLPTLLVQQPMPTIAIMIWFYMHSFVPGKYILKICILLASIVQAILAIIIAGRAAMVYWMLDFVMIYSLFYQSLSKSVRRWINISGMAFGLLFVSVFLAITVSRFDGMTGDRDPFESVYGYAGQHVNNFCCLMSEGDSCPFYVDRTMPFISKFFLHEQFDLNEHYIKVASHVKAVVNVFDTYGAELYVDMGVFFYILFHLMVIAGTIYIIERWKDLPFDRLLMVVIMVAFVTHGLFAWPFVHHYTTIVIVFIMMLVYMFRFQFKV